jgi:NAD(P)H dehydrogenase (quinone)
MEWMVASLVLDEGDGGCSAVRTRRGAGDGRTASATRADYAAAAVAVLTGSGHQGKVHDLSGDVAWSFPELTAVTGREIMYKNVSSDEHLGTLLAAGVPPALAEVFVANYRAIAEGGLSATQATCTA